MCVGLTQVHHHPYPPNISYPFSILPLIFHDNCPSISISFWQSRLFHQAAIQDHRSMLVNVMQVAVRGVTGLLIQYIDSIEHTQRIGNLLRDLYFTIDKVVEDQTSFGNISHHVLPLITLWRVYISRLSTLITTLGQELQPGISKSSFKFRVSSIFRKTLLSNSIISTMTDKGTFFICVALN